MLARLHQAEMALGQRQRRVAQDRADHRQAERLDRVARQPPVPLAAQPVEHDAGDPHRRIVARKTLGDRRRRLRLARHVEHQQHRQAVEPREIGGRAGAPRLGRDAVEQAHRAFDHHHVGVAGGLRRQRGEQRRRHRPAVEIDAARPVAASWKPGIDVVRPGFRACARRPRRASARSSPMVTEVLPEPGARRADDDRAGAHRPNFSRSDDDMADDDQGRGDDIFPRRRLHQRAQRRDHRALLGQRRVLDQRRRRVVGQPAGAAGRPPSRPYASGPYR